ncbi:methyl-accepting chemotaxis protein [Uliginosibacterium sp. 31-16]|uniref:methyl-accepting chemotaxis protein n=1 Tax=Uliginosibacterium sp. 31-16 TaxID=3068315 RepID=UPI00273E6060|nr:methyl-accepting chemotaxis protein [Uliginosibacterium sp. 31-16]MDP5238948.1 methyl-accepting chemotaxis protein [Uliginosibacterium sp. 31-16]
MARFREIFASFTDVLQRWLPAKRFNLSAEARARLHPGSLANTIREQRAQFQRAWQEDKLGAVFNPGIRHLNRLSYPWKFGLIGLLALASIGFYVISLNVSMRGELNAARSERAALELYAPVAGALQKVQGYVLLGHGVATNPELRPTWQARGAEVDTAFKAVDAQLARDDAFDMKDKWTLLKAAWQKLRAAEAGLSPEQIKTELPGFGRQTLDFIGDLGEASGLVSDKGHDSNYLADSLIRKIPQAADRLAALNNNAIYILGSRDMGAEWIRMSALTSNAGRGRDDLHEALRRAGVANAALLPVVQKVDGAISEMYPAQLEITDREIVKGSFAMSGVEFAEVATKASDVLYAQIPLVSTALAGLLDARVSRLDGEFWTASLLGAGMLLVLGYFAAGLFVTILHSIAELGEGAWRIGEGDLSSRIAYSARDEMLAVAEQFNHMAATFGGVIRQVQETASELVGNAETLSSSAAQVANGSERQSEAASSMAAAVEEMTVGIDEISRSASAADEASTRSGQLSQEGGEVVQRTVAEMEQIAGAVNESARVIEELGRNSRQIHSIVKSIKEIADQTNLLALNASIEAARAGDEGRGFSVVADEVRKLADRTTKATAEIGGMVGAIQAGTTRAVAAMQDGVRRVQDGVQLTNRSGEAMQRIREESDRVVRSVSEISAALREQASASTGIARSVENIAQMAETNNAVVAQTSHTARHLASLAQQLGQDVKRFRI